MFEHHGESDVPDFSETAAREGYDGSGLSPDVPASDIIPTEMAESLDEAVLELDEPVPLLPPWTLKHVHYIGKSVAGEGLRPFYLKDMAEEYVSKHDDVRKALARVLTDPANQDSRPSEQLAVVRDRLAADFGDRMNDVRFTLLTQQGCDALRQTFAGITDEISDFFVFGDAVLSAQSPEVQLFGPDAIIDIALHEGAHASPIDSRSEIVSNQGQMLALLVPASQRYLTPPSVQYFHTLGGFWEYKPDFKKELVVTGNFWEEAFSDAYRVRTREAMGTGYRHDHSYIYEQPARGIARSFAGNGLEVPLIDAETRAVAMPWKYCTGLLVESDEYWVSSTVPSLAAYGLDMLDERLPGLYEDAVASRQDPDLVRRFKERINSIRPGLYEEQAVMPYDAVHFQAGLRRIIGALGLEHATITG